MRRLVPRESFGRCVRHVDTGGTLVRDTRLAPHVVLPRHEHAGAYVCLVLSGHYIERARTEIQCTAGSVLVHPAGHVHENRIGGAGARCVNVEFEAGVLRDGPLRALAMLLDDEHHFALPPTFPSLRRLADALAEDDALADLQVHATTLELICFIARNPARDARAPRTAALARVVDHLESALASPPSIETLAALAGLHPHHFMRVFRSRYGETVGDYVRRRRLEVADAAVRGGDGRALIDIALDAGFCDQSHFTRAYRRQFGLTPGQRRRAG